MKIRSKILSIGMLLAFWSTSLKAEVALDVFDPRPVKQEEIEAAIERGNTLRIQEEMVPNALQNCSIILKRNGVRCGHVYMSMKGDREEVGAMYRFSMQMKAAVVQEDRALIVQTDGSFLLRSDLSLMSGEMTQHSDWQDRTGNSGLLSHRLIKISNKDEDLILDVTEQGLKDTDPIKKPQRKISLKTFKPMPSEVLVALAAFATKKNMLLPGLITDAAAGLKAVCVPVLNFSEFPEVHVRPAWVSFLPVTKESALSTGLSKIIDGEMPSQVRIRYFKGGLVEEGLKVQPPTPEEWAASADYGINERQRVVALPKPSEEGIVFEAVDPAKLNPREPFEFSAILKSYEVPDPNSPSQKNAPEKNPEVQPVPKPVSDPSGCPVP